MFQIVEHHQHAFLAQIDEQLTFGIAGAGKGETNGRGQGGDHKLWPGDADEGDKVDAVVKFWLWAGASWAQFLIIPQIGGR